MARVWDIATEADAAIDAAAAAVMDGSCIVLPTDTVYGIGADAASAHAVQGLLDAKERGRDMPPPVLIAEVAMLRALAEDVSDDMLALAEAFWPGRHAWWWPTSTCGWISATGATPSPCGSPTTTSPVDLLRATGPLAVSSANVYGQPAATTIAEAHGPARRHGRGLPGRRSGR